MLVLVCVPISGELATTLIEVMPVGRRSAFVGSVRSRVSDPLCVQPATNSVASQIFIRSLGKLSEGCPPAQPCGSHGLLTKQSDPRMAESDRCASRPTR